MKGEVLSDIARVSCDSPLGALSISARHGAIVALDWRALPTGGPPAEAGLLAEAAAQLADYFAGRRKVFDLPLKPAGSEHDRAVWDQMLLIPYGATRTYGDLALRIGSMARAVGAACGANPIPIIVPCHRVMAAGGGYGGYSGKGGVETKSFLLRLEGALLL